MRVLITGGFGYVGGRLAGYLRSKGHQVTLASRARVTAPAWSEQFEVVTATWDDAGQLTKVCEAVDVVVHAAGMNASDSSADPVAALEFNGVATARLANAAKSAGIHRFIYLSTAHVYASPLMGEISEDTRPNNTHPYATSHLAGEIAVLAACDSGKLDATILRLSNAVGAPVAVDVNCWMLLFCDLCREVVTNGTLTLRGAPQQQRNFIGMADVCGAIDHLLQRSSEALVHRVFNVGAPTSMSLLAMAQLIRDRCRNTLGIDPPIGQPSPASSQHAAFDELVFRTDRLVAAGYRPSADLVGETDAMLRFCQQAKFPIA